MQLYLLEVSKEKFDFHTSTFFSIKSWQVILCIYFFFCVFFVKV